MESRRVGASIVGGLVSGIVFGAVMHAMGMIGMIAGLVGGAGAALGWLVHLVISAIIGAGFGLTFARAVTGWSSALGLGALYGAIWWGLGPLLIMPLWMGRSPLQFNAMTWMSLGGHLMFGVTLGAVYIASLRTAAGAATDRLARTV